MQDNQQDRNRVSRRSSTGTRGNVPDRSQGERISIFDDPDSIYPEVSDDDRRYDDRDRRYDDRDRRDERDRRYDDRDRRYDDRDRRYDDRDRRYDDRDRRYDDRDRRYDDRDRRYDDRDRRYDDRDRRYDDRDRRYDDRDRRYDDRDRRYDDRDRRYDDRDRRYDDRDRRYDDRDRDDRRDDSPRDERTPSRDSTASRNKKRSSTRRGRGDPDLFVHQIVPYVMFWVALFAGISFVLCDLCGLDNGLFGNWLADFLRGILGYGAYALPLFLVVFSLRWKKLVTTGLLAKKLVLATMFLFLFSGIAHVFIETSVTRAVLDTTGSVLYQNGIHLTGGGFFGGFVGEWLGYALRLVGTILLACPLLLIIGVYLIGMTLGGIRQRVSAKFAAMSARSRERRQARYSGEEERRMRKGGGKGKGVVEYEGNRGGRNQPAPAGRNHYEFGDDDESQPTGETKPRRTAGSTPATETPAPARRPVAEQGSTPNRPAPAPETELDDLDLESEIVDIPDDEIEEPQDDVSAILTRSGAQSNIVTSVEDILDQVLAETSTPPAPAPAPATPAAEQPQAATATAPEGEYYAPFALPVRPFPDSGKATPAATSVVTPVPTSVATPVTETPVGQAAPVSQSAPEPEEVLGEHRGDYQTSAATLLDIAEEHTEVRAPRTPVTPATTPETPVTPPTTPATATAIPVAQPSVTYTAAPVTDPVRKAEESTPVGAPGTEPRSGFGAFSFVDDAEEEEREETPVTPARGVKMTFADVDSILDGDDPEEQEADEDEEEIAFTPVPNRERVETPVRPVASTPRAEVRAAPVAPAPAAPAPVPPPAPREYRCPPVTLLNEDPNLHNEAIYEELEETKEILRETLASFDIQIQEEINCSHGPTVTRYELRPEKGVRVRSIINRSEDISLNLSASVRIEAPIPGKPAVGIEVPNRVRETVYMRTVLESEAFRNSTAPLEVPLGVDVGGDVRLCNIAKMPHLLIAGTSGSGKSVCINSLLLSLICKTSPADLRLILIDPKKVEFTPYNDIPHLYLPIISEMQYAAGALACAVQEMERRFSLIMDVGVRDIRGYNEITKNDPDREHLPYIIIVIDEFADLKMGATNNDAENFTCRLAQKARAAGIHLIIGTQRPSVDVITGKLKGNIAARVAFKVRQQVDSRTILDETGAESLVGYGDMLFSNSTDSQMIRLQGPFVGDEELERMLNYVRKHNDPVQYNQAFMEQIEAEVARAANAGRKGNDVDDDDDEDGEDPVFREAVRLAVETQKIATSLLQRRLSIGYGRAAKIIDRMEALGYVSPSDGNNKPRRVLITPQQYAAMMMNGEEEFDDEF